MAFKLFMNKGSNDAVGRTLIAGLGRAGIVCAGVALAANNSVQGAKKDDGGYDTDAPTAILIEAGSGSVLFEKNPDELRAPSSMITLMTTEVVFSPVKAGDVKLTDQYLVSENAWRKGGAPAGGPTMFAGSPSRGPRGGVWRGAGDQTRQ